MEFTYEKNDVHTALERFEWDNVWFEQTGIADKKRILYVGDSISCGARRLATEVAEGEMLFSGFGTSKAIDNPLLVESVQLCAKQFNRLDAIIFNNGLHGWHLKENEYGEYYDKVVAELRALHPCIPFFIVLSTHLNDENRARRCEERNREALAVAEKYGLGVIDLHKVSLENKHLLATDGVHFTTDGYTLLAKEIVSVLREKI